MTHEELRRIQRTAVERAMAAVDEEVHMLRSRYMDAANTAIIEELHQAIIERLYMLCGEPAHVEAPRPEVRVSGR